MQLILFLMAIGYRHGIYIQKAQSTSLPLRADVFGRIFLHMDLGLIWMFTILGFNLHPIHSAVQTWQITILSPIRILSHS